MIPVLELRETTYPSRGGHTVFFDWPPDLDVPGDEAKAPEAIAEVKSKYQPLNDWRVEQWCIGALRRADGLYRLAVVAHQARVR